MFRRRWIWFGKLVSDEGFSLAHGNRCVTYGDERGSYEFGFEDGLLFPRPFQVAGEPRLLNQSEVDEMVDRIVRGIKSEGLAVQVYSG